MLPDCRDEELSAEKLQGVNNSMAKENHISFKLVWALVVIAYQEIHAGLFYNLHE